jgi:hypothetical protein
VNLSLYPSQKNDDIISGELKQGEILAKERFYVVSNHSHRFKHENSQNNNNK